MPAKSAKGRGRGRHTWAKGSKLTFLESFKDEYLATADPGGVYTKVTALYLEKYGYDLPHDAVPSDTLPAIPSIDDLPYAEQLAEQERREDIKAQMRLRIGNWLRHRYKRKQTDQDMILEVLQTMSTLSAQRPHRRTPMSIYWAENYAVRLRKDFEVIWNKAKDKASPDARISMCTAYVTARYAAETPAFRKELEERADREYAQALEAYNNRNVVDGSPEALHRVWEEADSFLHVFVDAIAKKFGMSVSLLLVGPLGAEQGKISMRSAHSSNPGSMTNLIWPEFDKQGFSNVQASLIKYGESVFSPAECKRRIISVSSDTEADEGLSISLPDTAPPSPPVEEPEERLSDSDDQTLDGKGLYRMDGTQVGAAPGAGTFTQLLGGFWDDPANYEDLGNFAFMQSQIPVPSPSMQPPLPVQFFQQPTVPQQTEIAPIAAIQSPFTLPVATGPITQTASISPPTQPPFTLPVATGPITQTASISPPTQPPFTQPVAMGSITQTASISPPTQPPFTQPVATGSITQTASIAPTQPSFMQPVTTGPITQTAPVHSHEPVPTAAVGLMATQPLFTQPVAAGINTQMGAPTQPSFMQPVTTGPIPQTAPVHSHEPVPTAPVGLMATQPSFTQPVAAGLNTQTGSIAPTPPLPTSVLPLPQSQQAVSIPLIPPVPPHAAILPADPESSPGKENAHPTQKEKQTGAGKEEQPNATRKGKRTRTSKEARGDEPQTKRQTRARKEVDEGPIQQEKRIKKLPPHLVAIGYVAPSKGKKQNKKK
ncbi:hypothetical protein EYR40_002557 [Pleurotus pulmonarius]|nr:hypothetical protein EYR40_002557 [Pleurotus pulmonarius]